MAAGCPASSSRERFGPGKTSYAYGYAFFADHLAHGLYLAAVQLAYVLYRLPGRQRYVEAFGAVYEDVIGVKVWRQLSHHGAEMLGRYDGKYNIAGIGYIGHVVGGLYVVVHAVAAVLACAAYAVNHLLIACIEQHMAVHGQQVRHCASKIPCPDYGNRFIVR